MRSALVLGLQSRNLWVRQGDQKVEVSIRMEVFFCCKSEVTDPAKKGSKIHKADLNADFAADEESRRQISSTQSTAYDVYVE